VAGVRLHQVVRLGDRVQVGGVALLVRLYPCGRKRSRCDLLSPGYHLCALSRTKEEVSITPPCPSTQTPSRSCGTPVAVPCDRSNFRPSCTPRSVAKQYAHPPKGMSHLSDRCAAHSFTPCDRRAGMTHTHGASLGVYTQRMGSRAKSVARSMHFLHAHNNARFGP
jgi:hypothetical protein